MSKLSQSAKLLNPTFLTSGLTFGESPRYHELSRLLFVADMIGAQIYTIDASGTKEVIIEVENQPNGMCFAENDTALIYSSMFDAKLYRYDVRTGASELYADLESLMTGYCGDMVIDAVGRVYIDDTGARVLHGETPRAGRILRVDPLTRAVSIAADNIVFPNGITIDSAGTHLFVAETFKHRFEKFDINANGELSNRTTIWHSDDLAHLVNQEVDTFHTIDGVAVDAEDGIWFSMLGYQMFVRRDKHDNITHHIPVDGDATACALGGDDGRTLYLVVNKMPESESFFEAMVAKRTKCSIYTVRVDTPRSSIARP